SLHGTIEMGPGTLSSTTAFQKYRAWGPTDLDHSNFVTGVNYFPINQDSYSQEFLYTTNQLGMFHAVAGVSLFRYDQHSGVNIPGLQGLVVNDFTKSQAVFGEGVFDVTDQFSITAGVRYTSENRKGFYQRVFPAPIAYHQVDDATFDSVTPRLSLL